MTEVEKMLLEELRGMRRETGEEFGEVKGKLSEVHTSLVRLDQKFIDHCRDTGMHPPAARRPCDDLRRHLSRHWAVFICLLGVLAAEVVAVVIMGIKLVMASGRTP